MEFSPLLDPRFLFPLLLSVVGLIGWLVRLEAKTIANAQQIAKLEQEIVLLWKDLEAHRLNQDIHFNLRISQQVEQSNERRFNTIEKQLVQINDKLDRLAERK